MSSTHIPTTISYEQMMALFQETREQIKESATEFDRRMAEQKAEADRRAQEADRQMAELRLEMKRTAKEVGNLGNNVGRMVEHMIGEGIIEKFQALGYGVTHPVIRNCSFSNGKMAIYGEFDLMLVDTNVVILISAKLVQEVKDVNHFMEKIDEYRRHIDAVGFKDPTYKHLLPGTRFVGAIAGGAIEKDAMKLAQENGLYVIVHSGDAVDIVDVPEGFQARQW
jgi:HAMP domain-containing protein